MRTHLTDGMSAKSRKRGFTLTEVLVVVAIIAVVAMIAVPSIISLRKTMRFRQRNDYAKSIFTAAQSNLANMRSEGNLDNLQKILDKEKKDAEENPSSGLVPPHIDPGTHGFPITSDEYYFSVSGDQAFDTLLPPTSIDSTVRDESIIIEFNPITGNVFSVFYSEDMTPDALAAAYHGDPSLPRDSEDDTDARRDMMLGYYSGSELSQAENGNFDRAEAKTSVRFENGQEGKVVINVVMPRQYYGQFGAYANGLVVNLTVTGEISHKSFVIPVKDKGTIENCKPGKDGKSVDISFVLDSLKNYQSFANLSAAAKEEAAMAAPTPSAYRTKSVTAIKNASVFDVLPGEDVTLKTDVKFKGPISDVVIDVTPGIQSNINPLFDSLTPSAEHPGKYIIGIRNGRNLQNLNLLPPAIASKIEGISFEADINWQETIDYYDKDKKNSDPHYMSDASEAPGRALPYFVPVQNPTLFGTARFIFPGKSSPEVLNEIKTVLGVDLSSQDGRIPWLTDELDKKPEDHAIISGHNKKVSNLLIDATKYTTPTEGKFYVTGNAKVNYDFTGLFSYVNTDITELYLVNPKIKGQSFGEAAGAGATVYNNPATGALCGATGYDAQIQRCGVYLSPKDGSSMNSFRLEELTPAVYDKTKDQQWYGVSGEGAVGGLVGYAKSKRVASSTNNNEFDRYEDYTFLKSFAAVPVSGNMRKNNVFYHGYSSGVGGLVGNAAMANFYSCYASGDILANGFYLEEDTTGRTTSKNLGLKHNGKTGHGAGGFIGTARGNHFVHCFATGNVAAEKGTAPFKTAAGVKTYTGSGAGSFAGFMCYDSNQEFGLSGVFPEAKKQNALFYKCYAVGSSHDNNDMVEKFLGAGGFQYGSLNPSLTPEDVIKMASHNRYLARPSASVLSDTYAVSMPYSEISSYRQYSKVFPTVKSNKVAKEWMTEADKAGRTHSYRRNSGNKLYPFPQLNDMDYYGSWPNPSMDAGVAYYEKYQDKSGVTYGYYLNEDSVPSLTLRDDLPVLSDGYAIVSSHSKKPSEVTIGNKTYKKTGTNKLPDSLTGAPTEIVVKDLEHPAGTTYYIRQIPKDMIADALKDSPRDFYTKMEITFEGEADKRTVYLNFNTALSQINPVKGWIPPKPANPPATILIRTARQFRMISEYPEFWTEAFNYLQTLDINAQLYEWADAGIPGNTVSNSVALTSSIGSKDDPNTAFNGTYSGPSSSAALNGFIPGTGKYTGLFNSIGVNGRVSNLVVALNTKTTKIGAESSEYTGIVAGSSFGTLENVLVFTGNLPNKAAFTISGTKAAGALAGFASGTIKNCTVNVLPSVNATITAPQAGGLIGQLGKATVFDCKSIFGSPLTLTGTNVGGFTGYADGASFKLISTELNSIMAKASTNVGGLAGTIANTAKTAADGVSEVKVVVNGPIAGSPNSTVAGLAANTSAAAIENATVTLGGKLTGMNAAGILGNAQNTTLHISHVEFLKNAGINCSQAAAGVVCNLDNTAAYTFYNVYADLDGTQIISANQAAGFAVSIISRADSSVSLAEDSYNLGICNVNLKGSYTTGNPSSHNIIKGAKAAAGFVCTTSGTKFGSCHTYGVGSITSDASAAGFAGTIENSKLTLCGITPVLYHSGESYLSSDPLHPHANKHLAVSSGKGGASAAGFAVSADKDSHIENSFTLCALSNGAAGFTASNSGLISGSTANIDLTDGFAFVKDNSGSIRDCYSWYGDDKYQEGKYSTTVAEGIKNCVSSYFVDRDCPILYIKPNAAKTAAEIPEEMFNSAVVYDQAGKSSRCVPKDVTPQMLNRTNDRMTWYDSTHFPAFPYLKQPMPYPMPMLSEHYGNWARPAEFGSGVVYYEHYQLPGSGEDKYGLSVMQFENQLVNVSTKNCPLDNTDSKTPKEETPKILESGYAVFYCSALEEEMFRGLLPFDEEVFAKDSEGNIKASLPIPDTIFENGYHYTFREIDISELVNGTKTITSRTQPGLAIKFSPWFAQEFHDLDKPYTKPHEIRDGEHLNNMALVENDPSNKGINEYKQSHHIHISADDRNPDGSFNTVHDFKGNYHGGGYDITADEGFTWIDSGDYAPGVWPPRFTVENIGEITIGKDKNTAVKVPFIERITGNSIFSADQITIPGSLQSANGIITLTDNGTAPQVRQISVNNIDKGGKVVGEIGGDMLINEVDVKNIAKGSSIFGNVNGGFLKMVNTGHLPAFGAPKGIVSVDNVDGHIVDRVTEKGDASIAQIQVSGNVNSALYRSVEGASVNNKLGAGLFTTISVKGQMNAPVVDTVIHEGNVSSHVAHIKLYVHKQPISSEIVLNGKPFGFIVNDVTTFKGCSTPVVEDCLVEIPVINLTGKGSFGMIVGHNGPSSIITNCTVNSKGKTTVIHADGGIMGSIVGRNEGSVSKCTVTGLTMNIRGSQAQNPDVRPYIGKGPDITGSPAPGSNITIQFGQTKSGLPHSGETTPRS